MKIALVQSSVPSDKYEVESMNLRTKRANAGINSPIIEVFLLDSLEKQIVGSKAMQADR